MARHLIKIIICRQDFVVFFVLLFVAILVFRINISVVGPMIQPDEGSYLASAAAISGYLNDLASSYSAGYSVVISPAFIAGSDPSTVWYFVKAINAIIYFMLSVGVWRLACTSIIGGATKAHRISSVAVVVMYPMWIIMVGYSFSQLAFACVFVWAVYFLQRFSEFDTRRHFILFGFAGASLYWFHPTGVAVIVSGAIFSMLCSIRSRSLFHFVFFVMASALSIASYKYVFQPWLFDRMTIGGSPSLHYPEIKNLLSPLTSVDGLYDVFGRAAGHVFYLTIGTLGLFWIGIQASFVKANAAISDLISRTRGELINLTHVFLLLCVAGVMSLSVLLFSSTPEATRLDHWMYGRYVEGVIAPVLLLGSFHFSSKKAYIAAIVSALSGLVLYFLIKDYGHTARFNVPTFWQDFFVRDHGVFWWLIYGLLICLAVAALGKILGQILIICFFLFCVCLQVSWHERASTVASMRWEAVSYVRENVNRGSCVGFDHSGIDGYSRHVFWFDFAFQLYDYKLQRLSPRQWISGECGDLLFSYKSELDRDLGVDAYIIAVSPHGGPSLWKMGRSEKSIYPVSVSDRSPGLLRMLSSGWYGLEKNHVWSSGNATILLPVPKECSLSDCYVSIKFSVFGASPLRPTDVSFFAMNSGVYYRGTYTSDGPFEVAVKINPEVSENKIKISVPGAASPEYLHGSEDKRTLGVAVYSISLK